MKDILRANVALIWAEIPKSAGIQEREKTVEKESLETVTCDYSGLRGGKDESQWEKPPYATYPAWLPHGHWGGCWLPKKQDNTKKKWVKIQMG